MESGLLARIAVRFTAWAERWIPDAYVFALAATALVVLAGTLGSEHSFGEVVDLWGGGFWELLPFTLQMALVIISGYVLATTRPVYRLIAALATLPRSPHGAVAFVAFFSMVTSWFNWGFSLIFSAMLAKEVARRVQGLDYRAVAASAFLGLGSIWAQGLSGSAALQMASASALPESIRLIVSGPNNIVPAGIIGLKDTIFLWQSVASVLIEIIVVTALMYFATPRGARARTAAQLGVDLGPSPLDATTEAHSPSRGPGEAVEHWHALNAIFVVLAGVYLWRTFSRAPSVIAAINLNVLNLSFLMLGAALHGTPARFMRAVKEATPGVWGVILQFPFYAGIAAVISKTHLSESIAHLFVQVSNHTTLPTLVSLYSTVLGVFVPSGGSKWIIEAPYVIQAAHDLQVHLGWMVAVYDLGEALANLIQPFWMLPILGLLGLRSRDVMGYTFLVFVVLLPLVLLLVTLLGATLPYPL